MRRALYLLAAMMVGAMSMASAQARPELVAHRDTAADNRFGLVVQVRGLLDDPVWLKELQDAYTIQLHWTVQLWRRQFIGGGRPKSDWDSEIHAIPTLNQYVYTERIPGQTDLTRVFSTLDSLKSWLGATVKLKGPRSLDAGDWYYVVDVNIVRITQEQLDRRASGTGSSGGGISEFLANLIAGGGPSLPLSRRVPITVPKQ